MEDAHMVVPDLDGTSRISLFGVFDGHGGRGVSRFAAKHLPELLKSQEQALAEGRYGEALREAFFAVDAKLRTDSGRNEVKKLDAKTKDDPPSQRIPMKVPKRALARMQNQEDDDSEQQDAENSAREGNDSTGDGAAASPSKDAEEKPEELRVREANEDEALAEGADEGEDDEDFDFTENNENEEETALVHIDPDSVLADATPEAQGCTAVVALVDWSGVVGEGAAGARVVIANAGDSRCILSVRRHASEESSSSTSTAEAVALSEDHKPELDSEKSRIEAAGGYVKDMPGGARVQGDLNLSRAMGDLRYKTREDLPPKAQIVTADPEIRERVLTADDNLLVLGCDGIWERNENQALAEKLTARLQAASSKGQEMALSALGGEVCDWTLCTSMEDEEFDGTGCDNMTILIVEIAQDGAAEPAAKKRKKASQ